MFEEILGASTGATELLEQDFSPASPAGFAWVHIEGNHYLRVKDGTSATEPPAEVTVVGVVGDADASCAWLLLG